MANIEVSGAGGLAQTIAARGHIATSDEPIEDGGADRGPTPYELLLSALGACAAITVRLYAGRKGWPLDDVQIRLTHAKVHVRDAERCEEGEDCVIDAVEEELQFVGPLDATQRERLAYIASRCPVHRTLQRGVRIEQRVIASN